MVLISSFPSQVLASKERVEDKVSVNKRFHPWCAKEKKAYTRLMSGVIKYYLLGRTLKFLTLTTSSLTGEGLSPKQCQELVQESWRKLHKMIVKYYRFDSYFKVVTTEGFGVIHILYDGDEIPFDWLMHQWQRIHGSVVLWIEDTWGSPYDYSNYVINQYVAGHGTSFLYSASQNWCYRGYLKDMDDVRDSCKNCSSPLFMYGNEYYLVNTEKFVSAWFKHLANKFLIQADVYLDEAYIPNALLCMDCGEQCDTRRLTCPNPDCGSVRLHGV